MCKTSSPSSIFLTAQGKFQIPLVSKAVVARTLPAVKEEEKKCEFATGRWTNAEHDMFLKGLKELGKNWKDISMIMKTRSPVQVRTHAQKFFLKMARSELEQGDQKEIGVEFTSLKKDTAVLSSCLTSVESEPKKFQYEVRPQPPIRPPTHQVFTPPVPTPKPDPSPTTCTETTAVPTPEAPSVSLKEEQDPTEELTFDGTIFDKDDVKVESSSQTSELSSMDFDSGFDSSDIDSAMYDSGLEDAMLNDLEPGCLYYTLPPAMGEAMLHKLLSEEHSLKGDEFKDNNFDISYPKDAGYNKRRGEPDTGYELKGLTQKKPRVFFDD